MQGVAFLHPHPTPFPTPPAKGPGLQGMILQISGSLPSLSGMEMACDYGNDIHTVARVPGPAFGHQIAYCNLLPRNRFPPFPPNQGKHFTAWAVGTARGGLSGGGISGMGVLISQPLTSVETPCSLVLLSLDPLLCSRPRNRRDGGEGQRAEHRQGQLHHLRLRPRWAGVSPHSVSGAGPASRWREEVLLLGKPGEET